MLKRGSKIIENHIVRTQETWSIKKDNIKQCIDSLDKKINSNTAKKVAKKEDLPEGSF